MFSDDLLSGMILSKEATDALEVLINEGVLSGFNIKTLDGSVKYVKINDRILITGVEVYDEAICKVGI